MRNVPSSFHEGLGIKSLRADADSTSAIENVILRTQSHMSYNPYDGRSSCESGPRPGKKTLIEFIHAKENIDGGNHVSTGV